MNTSIETLNILVKEKFFNNNVKLNLNIIPDTITEQEMNQSTCDKYQIFRQLNFGFKDIPHQGFKIHVACTSKNYQHILNTVFQFCRTHTITFKYISNLEFLISNLSGYEKLWATGKFITLYPTSTQEFKKIIGPLSTILGNCEGVQIYTDRRYGNSSVVFYRYGILNDYNDDNYVYDHNGEKIYQDYQLDRYHLPYFVEEPFPKNSDDSATSKKLFKQYHPQASLNKKCSGGVFIAKSDDNKELILKSAKIGFGDRSTQTIEKLKNEKCNLKHLRSLPFVPRVLDEFYEASDYFLVESKLPGIDIDTYRASVVESAFGDTKTHVYEKVQKVIQSFLSNLSKVHGSGIQMGDISSTNVLVDKVTGQVSFVDFNDSKIFTKNFNGHTRSLNKTVGFFNSGIYFLNQFEQDKQQAGYLVMALFSRANSFLAIDRTGKKSIEFFRKFAAAEKIPAIFVKIVEQLVASPNVSLESIQKELRDAKITEIYGNAENYQTSSLTEVINGLRRSIMIDSVNHSYKSTRSRLVKSDFSGNDNTIHHIINTSNYTSLMFRLIQNELNAFEIIRDADVQSSLISDLKLVHRHLEQLGEETSDEYLLPLRTIIPILYCSLFLDQKNHTEVQLLVMESFRNVVEKYAVNKDGKLIFRMSPRSRYCSPYLLNGVAGMLVVALNIRDIFGVTENDWLIGNLSTQLAKMRYPQNVTFSHGLSGIIWALLLTKRVIKTDIYDQNIQLACKDVATYLIRDDDGLYVVNEAFNQLSFSFQHGNRGVIFALKKAQNCFEKI